MADINDVVKDLPSDTGNIIRNVWDKLPETEKGKLQTFINQIPIDSRLTMLVGLVEKEFKFAFGKKSTVAIIGPANVGKSTLYNQLISSKVDRAAVSPIPGTTKAVQLADVGLFSIADTPGADAVGDYGEAERQQALDAASRADFLIIVFDAIQGIKRTELELFHELISYGKPYIVVLNKIDLVRREKMAVIAKAAQTLGLKSQQVTAISAKDGKNLENIILAIAAAEPEIVAALGQALPAFRWNLAWRAIISAASAAGLIGLLPLPLIDFIPLVITQSIMVIAIARIYNYRITPSRATELVVTFGIGFLGRSIFMELSRLVGVPGWFLAAAVAASVTVAMGYAAAIWFERGEKLTSENLKTISKNMVDYLLVTLKTLGKKKPSREQLRQTIAEALEKSPVAEDRSILDKETKPGATGPL
jgi:GTPase